ncbi:MAG: Ig-like domain repeat protein [Vulcanisaeta sp.]|jgi:hypothetical protein|uniref:Ig-like domain repeat protein n=1 Tax=Vulcanisaeta sp. TaxID=2020871 RepID=UPI003D14B589
MITILIIHAVLMALGIDPPASFTVTGITWYYGSYSEPVSNYTHIYTGTGINATMVININSNLSTPVNVSYTLSIGNHVTQGLWELQPGSNTLNITVPALNQGNYNASLSIYTMGYTMNYYFTVSSVTPGIIINTTVTKLYSGVPQVVLLKIMNSTPIPINSTLITITGTNIAVSKSIITVKPPLNESITVVPGPYSLGTAILTLKISYTDVGGYAWNTNETLTFTIVPTPVYLALSTQYSTINYGNYLPITINATTPVGPLQDQQLSIYVDNNYVVSITTNNYGTAQYSLLVNYGVGYHVLTITFTNTTYFQEAMINYTFIVLPGTVYIMAYVNNTNITYGSSVNIYVKLSPPISGGVLTISYVINGLSSTIGSYTPINGSVQVTWIPPQAGTYLITIYYTNPPNYLPSSTNLTIIAHRAPCTLSITINGTPEVLHEVIIISHMEPVIVNAKLNVLITGNNTSVSGATYINASGVGEYIFIPKLPGNYSIAVSWSGNINYKGCGTTYFLDIMKAPLSLYMNGSSDLIAAGGYETFSINIMTNIPISYVNGNLTIVIKNGNKTVSIYEEPITGNYMKSSIPFPKPGNYEILILYPGNDYVNSSIYGPYYITVLPGFLGIPWYMLLAYLTPIVLGSLIGIIINHKFRQA